MYIRYITHITHITYIAHIYIYIYPIHVYTYTYEYTCSHTYTYILHTHERGQSKRHVGLFVIKCMLLPSAAYYVCTTFARSGDVIVITLAAPTFTLPISLLRRIPRRPASRRSPASRRGRDKRGVHRRATNPLQFAICCFKCAPRSPPSYQVCWGLYSFLPTTVS